MSGARQRAEGGDDDDDDDDDTALLVKATSVKRKC